MYRKNLLVGLLVLVAFSFVGFRSAEAGEILTPPEWAEGSVAALKAKLPQGANVRIFEPQVRGSHDVAEADISAVPLPDKPQVLYILYYLPVGVAQLDALIFSTFVPRQVEFLLGGNILVEMEINATIRPDLPVLPPGVTLMDPQRSVFNVTKALLQFTRPGKHNVSLRIFPTVDYWVFSQQIVVDPFDFWTAVCMTPDVIGLEYHLTPLKSVRLPDLMTVTLGQGTSAISATIPIVDNVVGWLLPKPVYDEKLGGRWVTTKLQAGRYKVVRQVWYPPTSSSGGCGGPRG